MSKVTRLAVRLPHPLSAWLRAEAEARGSSMAQVIRDLIREASEANTR